MARQSAEASALTRGDAIAQLEAFREVLRAISNSPFDMEGVLGIVVERLGRLCNADMGIIYVPDREGAYRGAAEWGVPAEHAAYERENPSPIIPGTLVGRVVLSGAVVEIEDAATDPDYAWKEGQRIGGFRTMLGVPIRKGQKLIGVVGLARLEVRRFSAEKVELVRTFADQAALVIDNVRLLGTIERQREELARYLPSTVAALISTPRASNSWPATAARSPPSSATCAGSRPSPSKPSPRRSCASSTSTTRNWGAIIRRHGGTLEHYAGDGMMVFLNDPEPVADHPLEAVRMVLELRDRFAELAAGWRRQGFELGPGIGLSVGFATLGRIGFEGHYSYAVIGSVANLAARLCAIAEPGQIVLSERAYARVEALCVGRPLGSFELKGFRRPVEAYELQGLRTA